MKNIINKIFRKIGYVPYNQTRDLVYELYRESKRTGEAIHYEYVFGERIVVKVKTVIDL